MSTHLCGALAEKERRPADDAQHRAGVPHGITVHDHHRHGRVPSPVERQRSPLVAPEVCRERSAQAVVELDHRLSELPYPRMARRRAGVIHGLS
jgi:hypothetical protein